MGTATGGEPGAVVISVGVEEALGVTTAEGVGDGVAEGVAGNVTGFGLVKLS